MQQKRFQNKIAESRWSLTITALLCMLVWLAVCISQIQYGTKLPLTEWGWQQWLSHPILITLPCVALSTYLMVELNNANALIRIYSRMVSCTFLVLMTMATFQYTSVRAAIVTLCAIGFYTAAFHAYQDNQATGWIFYAFLCLSIASIAFIQVLFFLPLLWILMSTKLLSVSLKTLCASLLAVVLPYWFLIPYYVLTDNTQGFIQHFTSIADFAPLADISTLSLEQLVTGGFIILLFLIGGVHFLHTRQNDRIRTQMFYEIFVIVNSLALVFLVLQPVHFESLLGIIIVNTAPLIAHFIALTHTKWTNLLTIILLLLTVSITALNLWMPSLNF